MPYVETVYNRENLHSEVWSKPMREVAKTYNVSDVALRKTCRKMGVPIPPHGYWLMAEARRPKQPPLPQLQPGQLAEHRVSKWVPPEPTAEQIAAKEALEAHPGCEPRHVDAPFTLAVPKTNHSLHRFAAATREGLRKAKEDRDLLLTPGSGDTFDVRVSRPQIDRCARILSALAHGIEKAGHRVRPREGYEQRGGFLVDGDFFHLRVTERLLQTPHVPQPNEYFAPKFDHKPSGDLRITLGNSYGRRWEDRPKRRLEEQVNEIFGAILQAAADRKVAAAQRAVRERIEAERQAEQARIEEEKRAEQARIEARRREEQRRADALVEEAERWHRATTLRAFIGAVRDEAVRRLGPIQEGSKAAQWLQWATGVADRLDPMPELFGKKGGAPHDPEQGES